MSWLCNNCETLNDDNDNICLVCNSVPPSISEISLDCRKSQISWTSSNVNQLTLRYSQGDYNVTGLTSTSIDISVVETLVFIAKNDVAERIFRFTLTRSFVQEVLKCKKDDETWILASRRGTREDIEQYLSLYPDGRHIRAAQNMLKKVEEEENRRRREQVSAWRIACRKKTYIGYHLFLSKYPLSLHAEEARKRKSILGAELVSILNLCCEEAQKKAAIKAEEEAWASAFRLNSASGYSSFIEAYPLSKYRYIAEIRLKECQESEGWEQARFSGSIRELERFVNNYPESIHVAEARMIIITLRDQLKEDDAWKIALNKNTTESYRSYLRLYPIGRYSQTARFILAKKRKRIVKSFCIIIVVVVVAIIVAVISINRQSKGTRLTPGSGSGQDSGQTVSSTLPPHTPVISESELVGLEAKTEGQIEEMEVAKKFGDSRDTNMYKQAGQSLSNLKKYGSKKYNSLNDRYKAL